MNTIAIIGASGGIGSAFCRLLAERDDIHNIHALSRSGTAPLHPNIHSGVMDITDESSIEAAAARISAGDMPLDTVIITAGLLHHDNGVMPEKSLRDMTPERFAHVFAVNTFGPALVMKHFLPIMPRDRRIVFAALSARVGSISDNALGGWYAYRASKAALNMIIKNAAIETARRNNRAVIVGLHPGTVDSALSKPFQSHVPAGTLFTPDDAAQRMAAVLETLTPEHSGRCFAYDGSEIVP